MVRNSSGRVFIIHRNLTNDDLVLYYSDNDWSTSTRVVVDTANNLTHGIAIDSSNKLWVIAVTLSNEILIYSSSDNGGTWVTSSDIASGEPGTPHSGCQIVIDGDDRLHLAWKVTTSDDVRYCVSDDTTGNFDADDFGTTWDIESYQGAADGATDTFATSFGWDADSHWDFVVFGDGGSGYRVLAMYGDLSATDIRYKVKDWDAAFATGSGTLLTSSGTLPSLAVSTDDSTVVAYYKNTSNNPRVISSVDGGSTWANDTLLYSATVNQGGVSYDGTYFWVVVQGAGVSTWSQMSVNSSTGVFTLIDTNNNIAGTVPANEQREPSLRWSRYNFHQPEKVDIVFHDNTASRSEVIIIQPQLPNVTEDVVFDSTSTSNCTWDLTNGVASMSLDTGYGGLVRSTVSLDVSGAITVTDGDINIDAGGSCDTLTLDDGTSNRIRGTFDIATSMAVANAVSVDIDAFTADAILVCPAVTNNGTIRCTNNTVNTSHFRGPDNSTFMVWAGSTGPDIDSAGASSLTQFGDSGNNRGPDFNTNNIAFDTGVGSLTIDEQTHFEDIAFGTGTTTATGTVLIEVYGDWDSSAGTFTPNSCTVTMKGTTGTITT